jgi:hypothetical protein
LFLFLVVSRFPTDLAELARAWPPEQLVAIWNSLPDVVNPHDRVARYGPGPR